MLHQRPLYPYSKLARMFRPQSVAVVGASARQSSFGFKVLDNLQSLGFPGTLYAVNPKYSVIGEVACYGAVADLPAAPDCVVISVPREHVLDAVSQCVAAQVGSIIIFSSGFAETQDAQYVAQQARIKTMCQDAGIPVLGPNCIGFVNYAAGITVTFMPTVGRIDPALQDGRIGVVSQSGAMGFSLAQAIERGVRFSHLLTCGNACDVDVCDQIAFLAQDEHCKVVTCLFEGVDDVQRFAEAADLINRAGKKLVVYKIASSRSGAQAASSHTGALAGSYAMYQALFRRCGVIAVDTFEEMIETASFLVKIPGNAAGKTAVMAASGGAAIMAADMAEKYGIDLVQPLASTQQKLAQIIPSFGAARNPYDLTANVVSSNESLAACVDLLMSDPTYGVVVIPWPTAYDMARKRLKIYHEAAKKFNKIICVIWLSEWLEGPGSKDVEEDPFVAMFRSSERCFKTLRRWMDCSEQPDSLRLAANRGQDCEARAKTAQFLQQHPRLTSYDAMQIFEWYGIESVKTVRAGTREDVLRLAPALAYPAVLKVDTPEILHKTEVGGVEINVRDAADLMQRYDRMMARLGLQEGADPLAGVIIQSMDRIGTELIVGARRDALFGPIVVVGVGGVLVNLIEDATLELAPVDHRIARAMLDRLKLTKLLDGFRGAAPVDRDRVADVVVKMSQLIAHHGDAIAEAEVNPLNCVGSEVRMLDALITT